MTTSNKRWIVTLIAGVLPFLSALFYFVVFAPFPAARVIYAATKLFTLVWPFIVIRSVLGERFPRLYFRDCAHLRALPLGMLIGAAIVLSGFILVNTPVGEVVAGSAPRIRQKALEMGVLEHYWLFGGFLSLIHSAIEEYYWRFFVFGQLRLLIPRAYAHSLAALLFAAHHVVIATQFFPFAWGVFFGMLVGVGGLCWSMLYERQKTLAGAWLSHVIVDLGIFAIGAQYIF